MQPNNKGERRTAFLNFLLLFLISLVIIILLAFSSSRIPLADNNRLRAEIAEANRERDFTRKFTDRMAEVINNLDTINTKATNPDLVEEQIKPVLNELTLMIKNDSLTNKDFYRNIVWGLSELDKDRKVLRVNTAASVDVNKLNQTIETLKAQLESCKTEKDQWQMKALTAPK